MGCRKSHISWASKGRRVMHKTLSRFEDAFYDWLYEQLKSEAFEADRMILENQKLIGADLSSARGFSQKYFDRHIQKVVRNAEAGTPFCLAYPALARELMADDGEVAA